MFRVFIRHRRSENSPFATKNFLANGQINSLWLFFTQMWSLFKNILLQRYTFLLLLEFLMKTLDVTVSWSWSIVICSCRKECVLSESKDSKFTQAKEDEDEADTEVRGECKQMLAHEHVPLNKKFKWCSLYMPLLF